jgi:hypothetical protein
MAETLHAEQIEIVLPGGGTIVVPVPKGGTAVIVRRISVQDGVRKVKRYSMDVCESIRFFARTQ